jgi:hypothetical protein
MTRRRWLFVTAAAVAVSAVTVVFVLISHQHDEAGATAPTPSVPSALAAQPTGDFVVHSGSEPGERSAVDEVDHLLTGLPAAAAAGESGWLASDSPARPAEIRTVLPQGATVNVDRQTWRRTGAVASIDAVVKTSSQQRVRVVVVREPDAWRISETIPEN